MLGQTMLGTHPGRVCLATSSARQFGRDARFDVPTGAAASRTRDADARFKKLARISKLNRSVGPVGSLPEFLGLDPRQTAVEGRPPSCAPNFSVSRLDRVSARWNSLPQTRSQLPQEDLEEIMAALQMAQPAPPALRPKPFTGCFRPKRIPECRDFQEPSTRPSPKPSRPMSTG